MPSISMFFGIIIYMYFDEHNPPHFHARYQGYKAAFDFEGDMIAGELPPKQHKLVAAWAVMHADELFANWELLQRAEKPYRVDPLK